MAQKKDPNLAQDLLSWYDAHQRDLPWRAAVMNPYHVLLSEVMLQQTTVVTVIPYFNRFIAKWPTIESLAAASIDEVLVEWKGLGYYSRARNLLKTMKALTASGHVIWPKNEKEWLKLPGIGPYTAAAIASIAFDQSATIIDGNVMRVISRLYAIEEPLPKSLPIIEDYARKLTPQKRAGCYASAIMDLGATICRKAKPQCLLCPWQPSCLAFKSGQPERLPLKLAKTPKKKWQGVAFWIEDQERIWITRRDQGVLTGLDELPWFLEDQIPSEFEDLIVRGVTLNQSVRHIFTHIDLNLKIVKVKAGKPSGMGKFIHKKDLDALATSKLMQKVIALSQNPVIIT